MKSGVITGLSAEQYHATPAINKSGLDLIARSPLHYWSERLAPNREPRTETPAMKLGSAIHCAVLEPHRYNETYAIFRGERRTKDGKAEYEDIIAAGKIPISEDDAKACAAIAKNMKNSPAAIELFADGIAEGTVIWKDSETGAACKARPDWITPNGILVDIKSTEDARVTQFQRSVWDYSYHRQASWYIDGFEALTGTKPLGFVFAVFEKKPPYAVAYYIADDEMVELGRTRNRELLNIYARCLTECRWPGHAEEIMPIGLPPWAKPKTTTAPRPYDHIEPSTLETY